MSTHPIDIIANAIRTADGNHTMGAGQLAEHVARSIATDQRFVTDAVLALKHRGWTTTRDGYPISNDELEDIARVVLETVAGGA